MTRLEKILHLINNGHTYNPDTGEITSRFGNVLISKNDSKYQAIYFSVNKKKYMLRSHHFAWYLVYKEIVEEIDHKNGVRSDNRILNLRSVNRAQNSYNKLKTKGYTFSKEKNKWRAQIGVNRKVIHLGYFFEEPEAREAYLNAKKKYHIIN